uniref:Uncharacterized protein n=1 Tax=Steinernema glaseri TaxID=37863 RepID=A0A1I7YK58_9BILA
MHHDNLLLLGPLSLGPVIAPRASVAKKQNLSVIDTRRPINLLLGARARETIREMGFALGPFVIEGGVFPENFAPARGGSPRIRRFQRLRNHALHSTKTSIDEQKYKFGVMDALFREVLEGQPFGPALEVRTCPPSGSLIDFDFQHLEVRTCAPSGRPKELTLCPSAFFSSEILLKREKPTPTTRTSTGRGYNEDYAFLTTGSRHDLHVLSTRQRLRSTVIVRERLTAFDLQLALLRVHREQLQLHRTCRRHPPQALPALLTDFLVKTAPITPVPSANLRQSPALRKTRVHSALTPIGSIALQTADDKRIVVIGCHDGVTSEKDVGTTFDSWSRSDKDAGNTLLTLFATEGLGTGPGQSGPIYLVLRTPTASQILSKELVQVAGDISSRSAGEQDPQATIVASRTA